MRSVAAVVNLRARGGSEAVVRGLRARLPDARVFATSSAADAERALDAIAAEPPDTLVSGGGDGTASALVTGLVARGVALPVLALLPLGTGNGWARATGVSRAKDVLPLLPTLVAAAPLPIADFDLVETEGRLAPFAGTGWDAEIVSDYQKRRDAMPEPLRASVGSTTGYLASLFTRTIPRQLFGGPSPNLTLVSTGVPALRVLAGGATEPVASATLYEGPMSVAGGATIEAVGLGFRAFPFARAMPGRIAVRAYGERAGPATLRIRQLWRGDHPLPKSHLFFVTACRWTFDRDVPFEVAGDLLGDRRVVEMRLADVRARLVDWSALRARQASGR